MNTEIRVAIDKFKEVKDILKKFDNRDEAIEYLVNETKLSKEECSTAYDIITKIEGWISIWRAAKQVNRFGNKDTRWRRHAAKFQFCEALKNE